MTRSIRRTLNTTKSRADASAGQKQTRDKLAEQQTENAVKTEVKEEKNTPQLRRSKRGRLPVDSLPMTELRRSKRIKADPQPSPVKPAVRNEDKKDIKLPRRAKVKPTDDKDVVASNIKDATSHLQSKKLNSYTQYSSTQQSPFPTFPHPTPADCVKAHTILTSLHGPQTQSAATEAQSASSANCGHAPTVLEALTETILSQNTTSQNSTSAKLSMDRTYGRNNWAGIVAGGVPRLATAIASGGLANVKSVVIHTILTQTKTRHGSYSLEHLRSLPNDAVMRELLAFKGVGPKTASCVLLFCLQRPSFAVDTHVWRITGLIGWRPRDATREETYAHLEVRVPDREKFGLHVLMVRHGRVCGECKAGGKSVGMCALRRAFRGRGVDEGDDDVASQGVKVEDD